MFGSYKVNRKVLATFKLGLYFPFCFTRFATKVKVNKIIIRMNRDIFEIIPGHKSSLIFQYVSVSLHPYCIIVVLCTCTLGATCSISLKCSFPNKIREVTRSYNLHNLLKCHHTHRESPHRKWKTMKNNERPRQNQTFEIQFLDFSLSKLSCLN